ncbi:MAG: hypothetical protein AB1571_03770 [Nanoarchaeota archaeon]
MKKLYILFMLMFVIALVGLNKNASAVTGTCYAENKCSENVDKAYCESVGEFLGTLSKDSYEKCKLGCCKLSFSYVYTSEENCEQQTEEEGIRSFNWDPSVSSDACESAYGSADKGCCKVGSGEETECQASVTREACNDLGGSFAKGIKCNQVSDCQCKGEDFEDNRDCSDDRFSVAYSDSCGVEKVEECDYVNGEICNNGKCEQKLNCEGTWDNPIVEGDGGARQNFEQWCEYESAVGPGLDLPGTEHYKHSCINGKEVVESCGDARSSICIYNKVGGFSEAKCEKNEADGCSLCNDNEKYDTLQKREKCCKDASKMCAWSIGDDSSVENGACIPLVPPGNPDFRKAEEFKACEGGEEKYTGRGDIKEYNLANPAVEVGVDHTYDCITNCWVYSDDSLINANNFCRAQGDCGAAYDPITNFRNEGFKRERHDLNLETLGKDVTDNQQKRISKCYNESKIYKEELSKINKKLNLNQDDKDLQKAKEELENAIEQTDCESIIIPKYILPEMADEYLKPFYTAETEGLYGTDSEIKDKKLQIGDSLFVGGGNWKPGWVGLDRGPSYAEKRQIEFECMPWNPVSGGANCEKCNLPKSKGGILPDVPDELKENYQCTDYKCKSLGSSCGLVDVPEGKKCVDLETDKDFPDIIPDYDAIEDSKCVSGTCTVNDAAIGDGYQIDGKIKEFTKVKFGIKTINTDPAKKRQPELSICKYTMDPGISNIINKEERFNSMTDEHIEPKPDVFSAAHTITLTNLGGEEDKTYTYYISCKDSAGNIYPKLYAVRFTVNKAPDKSYPIIDAFVPKSGTKIAYDNNNESVSLEINERNDMDGEELKCRWSNQDLSFEQMPPENGVTTEVGEPGKSTFTSITLNNLVKGENKFYFRCKDQEENSAVIGKLYTLIKTDKLSIVNIEPKGNIFVSKFNLTVTTSGGAEQGKAKCEYGLTDIYEGGEMQETNSNTHKQEQSLVKGGYTYYIYCKDSAENIARAQSKVYVKTDTSVPKLVSISRDSAYGDKIKLVTNDETKVKCKYDTNDFSFDNGKDMQTVGNAPLLSHYGDYGLGTYFIKCRDDFGKILPIIVYT